MCTSPDSCDQTRGVARYPGTRRDAQALLNSVLTYEFACNLTFWSCVLGQVDPAQKLLQTPEQTLKDARDVFVSLKAALAGFRAELPSTAVKKASEFCEEWGVAIERRSRRKKRMPGEESGDAALSIQEEVSRIQNEAISTGSAWKSKNGPRRSKPFLTNSGGS